MSLEAKKFERGDIGYYIVYPTHYWDGQYSPLKELDYLTRWGKSSLIRSVIIEGYNFFDKSLVKTQCNQDLRASSLYKGRESAEEALQSYIESVKKQCDSYLKNL